MPLFSRRSSFRTPKKAPRRKSDSVPNISALDDSFNFTSDSLSASLAPGATAPAVTMKLGDHEIFFENGDWVSSKYSTISINGCTTSTQQNLALNNTSLEIRNAFAIFFRLFRR